MKTPFFARRSSWRREGTEPQLLCKGFCHSPHLDLDDSRAGRLGTCQQDSSSHIFRLEHIRLTDALLSSPSAECELGLDSAWADNANLDSLGAKFFVERLRKADLSELRRAVHRFACKSINTSHGRDHQDGALFLFEHDRNGVSGEQER